MLELLLLVCVRSVVRGFCALDALLDRPASPQRDPADSFSLAVPDPKTGAVTLKLS